MEAALVITPETLASLGISPTVEVHLSRDADQLGIDLAGPEHDSVDPSDFVEVSHD